MRLPLKDGQWAELRDRLTYAQGRSVRLALLASRDGAPGLADLDLALIRAYVSAWDVRDLDGQPVPLDRPELAPDDVVQDVSLKCMDAWKGRLDVPKATGEISPSTPPAPPSSPQTTISET